jgi:hypothetical protein
MGDIAESKPLVFFFSHFILKKMLNNTRIFYKYLTKLNG